MKNKIFSDEECEWLKSFFDLNKSVGGDLTKANYRRGNHRNRITNIEDKNLNEFLINKFSFLGVRNVTAVRVVRYCEGDYMGPHTDFGLYGKDASLKTIIIMLSDENDYRGGELYVNNQKQSKEKGSYVMISSTQIHEVKTVNRGVRHSMVLFLWEDDIIIEKNIL